MICPPYLKKGDEVAIVAPAGKVAEENIFPAIQLLEGWGLSVSVGGNTFRSYHNFSATDEQRASDLQTMLDNKNIKAIFCARGGYGTIRIIDALDFSNFKKNPKWIIGYSDITVLHSHIHATCGVQTIHATMPINFLKNEEATNLLKKAVFGESISYTILPNSLNKTGNTEGVIVGGNLSLLYALTGSKSEINTTEKILFIEDVGEYLYHLDRMIFALKRAGKLKDLSALVVGGMTDMRDSEISFGKSVEEIILDAVKEYHFPVLFDFPAGHVDRNLPIIFGKKLKISDVGKVVFINETKM